MAIDSKARRKRWLIRGSIIAASVAVFLVALELSEPAPPSSVRLATGSPGSAYHAYGLRLAARLKELRQKAGLTQAMLAGLMGRTGKGAFNLVSRLERGLWSGFFCYSGWPTTPS